MPDSPPAQSYQYEDFELRVVPAQAPHTYRVTVTKSAAGRPSALSHIDPSGETWHKALDAVKRDDTDEALILELGGQLFETLLPGDVEDAYRASMGYARREGNGLRLRLTLTEVPELAALPWEYLYDRQRDIFLGTSSDTPLSRFIEPQQVFPPPPPPQGALRLLTVISDPRDPESYNLLPLDAEKELRILENALQRLKARDLLEEIEPLRHAVYYRIREALREHRPHVLHFIGHGAFQDGKGKLILEDQDHYALELSDRAFRELLEGHHDTRLVVLNACQGATRATADAMAGMGPQLVSRGLPAVVAMQYPISDRAAISFTRDFYRALSHWYPIDVAVAQARSAVRLGSGLDRRDWGAPVLFMRDPDGLLFAPAETPTRRTETTEKKGPAGAQTPPPPRIEADQVDLIKLRQAMIDKFDQPSLLTLCSDLAQLYREQGVPDAYNVEYDNLRGGAPPTKILFLIDWHRRHSRITDLVSHVLKYHPDLADRIV